MGATNIALFLSQALHEAIQYDACDENNWDQSASHGNYTAASACGQVGQSYQDYDCEDACPLDRNMVILGSTHASWYGAPAPYYCGPKEIFPDALVWNYSSAWRQQDMNSNVMNDVFGTKFEFLKNVIEPLSTGVHDYATDDPSFPAYALQQDGKWERNAGNASAPNYSNPAWGSRTDVENCCWWGRGVIQTTGRCNFGKLNKYLISEFYNKEQNADINLCRNPEEICDNTQFPELKWNAGFFFWISEVQQYGKKSGGQYASWNIPDKIAAWFDAGKPESGPTWDDMIVGVSGIVNRGCPALSCEAGQVHEFGKREDHFKTVLSAMGII